MVHKIFLFLIILCFFFASGLKAQVLVMLPGTKAPYPVPTHKNVEAPVGYMPVFINYVGRHGSRFMTKPGGNVILFQLLKMADSLKELTPVGIRLKGMTELFLKLEKGNYKDITLLGKEEQQGIGERMLSDNKDVFDGKKIVVAVTSEVRTRQSADAFLKAFSAYKGEIVYNTDTAMLEDVLRFYDVSPAFRSFKKGSTVQSTLDSLERDSRTIQTDSSVCFNVFKSALAAKLLHNGVSVKAASKAVKVNGALLTQYLYDLYGAQFSITLEMEKQGYTKDSLDFSIAFTTQDLKWLRFKTGATDFLKKGPGINPNGIQLKIAVPLLADFIKTTDSALLTSNNIAAIFRFTHAEAISPFAALLGISIASKSSSSVFTYDKQWEASSIIPMSSNIQWIVYGNGSDYLLKVLLNEKEARIPVPTKNYPFYKWQDVREYYLKLLRDLNTGLHNNMHTYLMDVR